MQLSIKPIKILASILGLSLIAISVYNVIVSGDYTNLLYGFVSAAYIVGIGFVLSKVQSKQKCNHDCILNGVCLNCGLCAGLCAESLGMITRFD